VRPVHVDVLGNAQIRQILVALAGHDMHLAGPQLLTYYTT
jgi:hypothetical protein